MRLALLPQSTVAGLFVVRTKVADLQHLANTDDARRVLAELCRLLDEAHSFRHPPKKNDEWVTAADVAAATGWTSQWVTRQCRENTRRAKHRFQCARQNRRSPWLIHWPSFERWYSNYTGRLLGPWSAR